MARHCNGRADDPRPASGNGNLYFPRPFRSGSGCGSVTSDAAGRSGVCTCCCSACDGAGCPVDCSAAGEITVGEVEQVLGSQPELEPIRGAAATSEKLGASVERHLRRYFDLHGNMLPPDGLYQRILREVELPLIEIALEATGGDQAKCADLLGINRNTLRKKITELDIEVTRRRKLM